MLFIYACFVKELDLTSIRDKALDYHTSQTQWHFHILTPDCTFNRVNQFAFVLECPSQSETYVHYSDQPEKELARELSPLLHGDDVMDQTLLRDYEIPKEVLHMRERAIELNDHNVAWHHHMLFPGCIYNTHSPSYVLMLEDPHGDIIENITEEEPKEDIKQIESLFFLQQSG